MAYIWTHCILLGMSTNSTQFGQLAYLSFPTQPKQISVFGEETKNFFQWPYSSSSNIRIPYSKPYFYLFLMQMLHHTFSFGTKTKDGNSPSTSDRLSHADLVFRNPQVMVRSSKLLPFMPCWTVGGPVSDPETDVMWNCSTADPSNWKNMLQNWTAKIIQMSVETSTSRLYQWTKFKKSVGDASIGSVFHWQNITSRARPINRNVMASWTDATVVARPLHYRRSAERCFEHQRVSINAFQGVF